jgi:LysR family transcriptional regulator, glycine cleavage system transcriptional activator
VSREIAAGTLVRPFDLCLPGYRFYLVRTSGHPREKTIQAFASWLQSVI